MSVIKIDIEKEKNIGVPIDPMLTGIYSNMGSFIVALEANPKTYRNLSQEILKKFKLKSMTMIQQTENFNLEYGIVRVIYNDKPVEEIDLIRRKNVKNTKKKRKK